MSGHRSSFLDEIRRRKVVRVASVYAAVAYAVAETADLVFPRLLLPDCSVTLVIGLALAGFPLAVVLAWVFDVKDGGIVRSTGGAGAANADVRPRWLTAKTAAVVVLLVLLGVTAGWLAGRGAGPGAGAGGMMVRSIAVLPFVDMSPDRDMEYFGDGMAEEILNVLTKLPDLKVAGRTSSFSFKGKDVQLSEIGAALGVGTVLEGSVRRSADRLRITAQLVRTDDQSHLWSQTFDRGFNEDVFAVQDEIARAIAAALRIELGGADAPTVSDQRGTQSPEAYNAYLLGRFQWNKRTRDGVFGSITSFEEAIRIDPRFARAHAALADAHSITANFGWTEPHEAFPRARIAVDAALALEPDLSAAHTSLGAILAWYDWDFAGAVREYQRAIALDPANAFAHYWYAIVLDYTNRPDEARAEIETALALDPLALQIRNGLANHYQWRGDHESAIREYRAILAIDPAFHNARRWVVTALIDANRSADALAVLDSVPLDFVGGDTSLRAEALAQLGRSGEAMAELDVVRRSGPGSTPFRAARALAFMGRMDDAFQVLRSALDRRNYEVLQLPFVPASHPLRADPRFDGVLAGIGLLRYWQ